MPDIACFLLTPIPRAVRSLRRYRGSGPSGGNCALPQGCHDASVVIGEEDYPCLDLDGSGDMPTEEQKAELSWPTNCACGYRFRPEDCWQINVDRLFARSDGGAPITLHAARGIPGAMWDCTWLKELSPESGYIPGSDGMILCLTTPGSGCWIIDGPSTNGGRWTRTGVAPHITATPSILIGDPARGIPEQFHGWLRNGILVSC